MYLVKMLKLWSGKDVNNNIIPESINLTIPTIMIQIQMIDLKRLLSRMENLDIKV